MLFRICGALRRLPLAAVLIVLASGAGAHEGHDHGTPPPAAVTATTPRIATHSDAYELVGILRGDRLTIYLDDYATNTPITDAAIAVTVSGDEEAQATLGADGTYALTSPRFAGAGPLEVIFAVTAPSGDDLLIGTIDLPPAPAGGAVAAAPPSSRDRLVGLLASGTRGVDLDRPHVVGGVALAFGLFLGLALRSRSKLVPAAGLAVLALAASTAYALSHEGHDHGEAKVALPAGDAPRRLPDGTAFVPKPTQRLLEVRTTLVRPEAAQKAVTLIGRVIADPNRSGLVQSITGGRIIAPEGGLPRLGQAVKKGEVLAIVEQAVGQADRTTISERTGEIEQQIALAETKLRRIRQLSDRGISPQSQVVDAETELDGLKRRLDIVRRTRTEPEVLRAPIDGTISLARTVAGQVVGAQDVVFQIIDAKGFWVEALVFGEVDPERVTGASAAAANGAQLKLVFEGFSRALQQQATVVHFAIEEPPPGLRVGQPVTVTAQNGSAVKGIILPRTAVVRGGNGEALVWRHTDPERFEARPVRTEPFDATRVVVRAGLADGERIVTRGAELINQVR
jgi:membrane fusion protein, heavy metal efflux system